MVSPRVLPQLPAKQPLVLSLAHSRATLPQEPSSASLDKSRQSAHNLSVSQAQELICQFFLKQLKQYAPELVLQEFQHLFIEPTETANSTLRQALDYIIASGSPATFINTLKRSIYILINNWSATRQQKYIQQLVQLLSTFPNAHKTGTATLKRLSALRRIFVNSQDYQELKLFALKYENRYQEHWSKRYSSYLLVSQAVDVRKPLEQQEAALTYSKQLKEQFKFELAMYTARSSSAACQQKQSTSPNPTSLGDEVLLLIQTILKNCNRFDYASLARIFLNQNHQIRYKAFKQNLLNYLLFFTDNQGLGKTIKSQLACQLNSLYQTYHDQPWDSHLLLRTCKRLIGYFTTVDRETPSLLFTLLIAQGNALSLAILLLKIVLLCPSTYTHLESCLAQLIHYYKNQPESECQWLIDFLEIIQVTLIIYLEDVQYNLVNMSEYNQEIPTHDEGNVYRIFSQIKREAKTYQRAA